MMKKCGFTLIELLVVIAIIALLLAIIVPTLNIAKQQAGAAVCLSNQRQIMTAWLVYAGQNDSRLCSPDTDPGFKYRWVEAARPTGGAEIAGSSTAGFTAEEEINGIEEGVLYPYYENPKLLHCPTDKRYLRPPTDDKYGGDGGYRTYSLVLHAGATDRTDAVHKISEFKNSGSKFVLVEENDNRNWNWNSWEMNTGVPAFVDPFAVFHNSRSTLGFADGHAEKIVWKDSDTELHSRGILDGTITEDNPGFYYADSGNVDLEWLTLHYPRKH